MLPLPITPDIIGELPPAHFKFDHSIHFSHEITDPFKPILNSISQAYDWYNSMTSLVPDMVAKISSHLENKLKTEYTDSFKTGSLIPESICKSFMKSEVPTKHPHIPKYENLIEELKLTNSDIANINIPISIWPWFDRSKMQPGKTIPKTAKEIKATRTKASALANMGNYIDKVWPANAKVEVTSTIQGVQIYYVFDTPTFFTYDGRIYPTLYVVHLFPDCIPSVILEGKMTAKTLARGAHAMACGVVSISNPDLPDYAIVKTQPQHHKLAAGIAILTKDYKESYKNRTGKVAHTIHHLHDDLWRDIYMKMLSARAVRLPDPPINSVVIEEGEFSDDGKEGSATEEEAFGEDEEDMLDVKEEEQN